MADFTFNIAKGRVVEFYYRVENNDPANSAFIAVPLETAGLETDAVLMDKDTLADVLAGTTNEQTTMGRKILTDAQLVAVPAPDDTGNSMSVALPTTTWVAANGNPISKIVIAYDPDTTGGTDANIIPCTAFDFVATPTGIDLEFTAGNFFTAS